MTAWIEILLIGFTVLLMVPVTVLFAEVIVAVVRNRKSGDERRGERQRIAILMPAHNEALTIANTLRFLIPQLQQSDRLVVVADNCTDETAAIALKGGAEVIERWDLARRGKGYALDFGVRHLQHNPPKIVIIVDADCEVTSGAIDKLTRICVRTGRPVQALYRMEVPPGSGLKTRVAQFAWIVKNHVRPMGLLQMGLPCQLMGSGMAFPWACIRSADLASSHIVEDLKLGIDMALGGTPALFCPEALVISSFPNSEKGIRTQRVRWEHGHLSIIFSTAPLLLWVSLLRRDSILLMLGLDLCVPPLALLALLLVGIVMSSAVFYVLTGLFAPLVLTFIAAGTFAGAVILSWRRYGRDVISFRTLLFAPLYTFWKLPVYLKFLVARQSAWVRSKRDGDQSL